MKDMPNSKLEAWVCLMHARVHIIKTAPREAFKLLWAAEDKMLAERDKSNDRLRGNSQSTKAARWGKNSQQTSWTEST